MSDDADEFLSVLTPLVESLGARIVSADEAGAHDLPIDWRGSTIGHVQPRQPLGDVPELHGALERFVAAIERELGAPMPTMTRAQKQAAVRRLDDHGAFLLRGAVEDVAGWMGVSKVTLYSYLNAIGKQP